MYYVYCITNEKLEKNNVYKIGYSKTLDGRKKDFDDSTINLENWYYIDTITVSNEENAKKLESKIHVFFDKERLADNREFFKISDINRVKTLFKQIKGMKTEKLENGPITRIGESISNLRKTKELYGNNLTWILLEKIHNAYAAHAKNIWIKIENNGKTITYKDDGDGFTASQLKGFARNDRYHFNTDGPGVWGIGGKDSDRAIADYENSEDGISPVNYTTSTDGVYKHVLDWKICEIKKLYETPEVYCNIKTDGCHKGTIVKHDEIVQITIEKLVEAKRNLRFFCSMFKGMNINITRSISGNHAYETLCDYFDPLYLNRIDCNKEGLFTTNDGTAYQIENKTLVDYNRPDKKLNFKMISLYMSKEYLGKVTPFEKEFGTSNNLSGLYFVYRNTYLSEPIQSMSFKSGLFHAYNRVRILVIFNDIETAISFGIRSIKTEKIKITGNFNLKKYVDEDERNFEEIIINKFNFWSNFDDKQRDIKNNNNLEYVDAIKAAAQTVTNTDVVVTTDVVNVDECNFTKNKNAEKDVDKNEEKVNIPEAKRRFSLLSNEEKKNLSILAQYCASYGAFYPKPGRVLVKNGLLKSFDEDFDIMPWSMHEYVTSGINEVRRLYNYYKTKERSTSDTILKKLNGFINSSYEVIANSQVFSVNKVEETENVETLEPSYVS